MPDAGERAARLPAGVERRRGLILDAFDYLWSHPETGFREWNTHRYLTNAFEALGCRLTPAGNIPGFSTELDTGRPGPTVAVMGEMDALLCPGHPDADPETHAVHACGHCCQTAALLGLAAALREPGALEAAGLCGKIRLLAVPAEELIELDWRESLRRDGVIRYFGGKPEFLRRGLLDGADLAMMVHTTGGAPRTGKILGGSNGFLVKRVSFHGVAAHAGSAPHRGVNALYAAQQALGALNALRETFPDEEHIRVHPIITKGGSSVNAIPDEVVLECYIRGATAEAIDRVNRAVNRAFAASGAALGAGVTLCDRPGYLPRRNDPLFMELMCDAMERVLDGVDYRPDGWGSGCSDMGDVSCVIPSVHPYVSGAAGRAHGADYRVSEPESACVDAAKVLAAALSLLLGDGAVRAKEIIAGFRPVFASKEAYFRHVDSLAIDREAVRYGGDGSVTLDLAPRRDK